MARQIRYALKRRNKGLDTVTAAAGGFPQVGACTQSSISMDSFQRGSLTKQEIATALLKTQLHSERICKEKLQQVHSTNKVINHW